MSHPPCTLKELLRERTRVIPDSPFLLHEIRSFTYAQFAVEVHRVANAFLRLGVKKGDKVALLLKNCPEFLFAVFAAAEIGAVFVPVNTSFTAEEISYLLQHSEAGSLITTPDFLPVVHEIRKDCSQLRHVITLQGTGSADVLSWESFLFNASPEPPEIPLLPDELASITYTSGTTDRPKGVMLSHYAYTFAPAKRAESLSWNETDRAYVLMPLFHVNALCHMTIAMMSVGGSVVLREKFSASRFWDEVREYGVTVSSIMRTIPNILMNLPEKPDDAENPLRQVTALLPPEQHVRFEERFGVTSVPTYSLTEDVLSVVGPVDKANRKLGSCGLPNAPAVHKLRIVKESGKECRPGELGEITKQSPTVMKGYFKNPQATSEALRDGWLYTGDIGYVDEDGFLYFVDRKKDMIKRADENISAEEVERVLNSHPLIAESAVIGVPDPIRQEEVKACIVLKPPARPQAVSPEEIWEYCKKHLAPFKIPRYIEFRTELPKTPTEKIQKGQLRAEAQNPSPLCFDRSKGEPTRG
ncbi:MAG: AMP-binding protein [Candidatus Binatia bacterium]